MSQTQIGTPRRGRSLELLVKRIREHQSPEAIVRSPDFIADRDTGEMREVDIGVHVPREGGETFIAIECRDRKAVQSVEWVEQLISKKQSVGADVLIAVTASDFFRPARIKALKNGVLLARLSKKLPNEVAELAASWFITMRYLAPWVVNVELDLPLFAPINDDSLFRHKVVDRLLSLQELAQVWANPSFVRSLPRHIEDFSRAKFAKVGLVDIDAFLVVGGVEYPITGARLVLELNYGEQVLPLRAVQELSALDDQLVGDATAYDFGTGTDQLSEVIVDANTGELRWDLLARPLLNEGKVLIGGRLRASKPVSITTMRLDL
jgi:hypothetical protein